MNEKLTAYVLHELPPDERAEFEALMKSDPALREHVEDMRSFCDMLSHEISQDEPAAASLTLQQRASVIRAFATDTPEKQKTPQPSARPFWGRPAFLVLTAIAACAMVWDALHAPVSRMSHKPAAATQMNRGLSEEVRVTPATQKRKVVSPTAADPQLAAARSKVIVSASTPVTSPATPAPPLPPPPALPDSMPSVNDLGNRKMQLEPSSSLPPGSRLAATDGYVNLLPAKDDSNKTTGFLAGQNGGFGAGTANSKLPAIQFDSSSLFGTRPERRHGSVDEMRLLDSSVPSASSDQALSGFGLRYLSEPPQSRAPSTPESSLITLAESATLKQDLLSDGGAITGFDLAETPGLLGTWAVAQKSSRASLIAPMLLDAGNSYAGNSPRGLAMMLNPGSPGSQPGRVLSWTAHDGSTNSFSNFDTGIGTGGPFIAAGGSGQRSNHLLRLKEGEAFDVGRFGGPLVIEGPRQPDRAKVERQLQMAYSYYNLGDYTNSIKTFQDILRANPYDDAARRGMERAEQKRSEYFDTARDIVRARMLAEVDKGWEDAIPAAISASTGPMAPLQPAANATQLLRGTNLGGTPSAEGKPASPGIPRGPVTVAAGSTFTLFPGKDASSTSTPAPAAEAPLALGNDTLVGVAGQVFRTATATPSPAAPAAPAHTPVPSARGNYLAYRDFNGVALTVNEGNASPQIAGANTYTETTTVSGGTLAGVGQVGAPVTPQRNATVTSRGTGAIPIGVDSFANAPGVGIPSESAAASLPKVGEGILTLAGGTMGSATPQQVPPQTGGTLDTNGLIAAANASGLGTITTGTIVIPPALEIQGGIVTTNPQPPASFAAGATINGVPIVPTAPVPDSPERQRIAELTEQKRRLERHLEDLERQSLERSRRDATGEAYTRIYENPFLFVGQQPLSTFSIDVDTASYANVRRFLNDGQLPPPDAVRLEELINYFPYAYEGPADGKPFGVMADVAEAPWQPLHRIVRVALKGREIHNDRGGANFVFLVDVSGSMNSPDKLPLVQQSLLMLTDKLREDDRVAIVVYAGNTGLALPSTKGSDKATIRATIQSLKSGGSTNGSGGITLAYEVAAQNFIKGGVNRVILCTDGDFNVGISSPAELEKLIAEKAKSRIFLSVLGFGTGNLQDRTMETLADKGNGNYAYIDSLSEARKVLVEQMEGTLVTIAKDVKIQVEFNPAQVAAYRLLGYENRLMAKEDFNNDKKDAGEIGAGHTVTALYEVVPAAIKYPDGRPLVDDLKYAPKPEPVPQATDPQSAIRNPNSAMELLTVKLRYKQPEGDKSDLLEVPVADKSQKLSDSPKDFQFAASVAGFGMLLRGSQYSGDLTWDMVRDMALRGKAEDSLGYRGEFLQLIDKARGLSEQRR